MLLYLRPELTRAKLYFQYKRVRAAQAVPLLLISLTHFKFFYMQPNGYLQLAEGTPAAAINKELLQYYVPVATKTGTKLMREDVLDDLPDDEFNAYLDAIEYGGFGMGGKKRQARIERRQARKDKIADAKAGAIAAGTYESTGATLGGKLLDVAGQVVGGKLQKAGAGADVATDTTTPAKSNTIYYILGGAAVLGLLFIVMKPKHH